MEKFDMFEKAEIVEFDQELYLLNVKENWDELKHGETSEQLKGEEQEDTI